MEGGQRTSSSRSSMKRSEGRGGFVMRNLSRGIFSSLIPVCRVGKRVESHLNLFAKFCEVKRKEGRHVDAERRGRAPFDLFVSRSFTFPFLIIEATTTEEGQARVSNSVIDEKQGISARLSHVPFLSSPFSRRVAVFSLHLSQSHSRLRRQTYKTRMNRTSRKSTSSPPPFSPP